MSIEDSIDEIKKGMNGLDKVIPPKKEELQKYHYNHFNFTLPNPTLSIEHKEIPFGYMDAFFAAAMTLGFICFGIVLKGL